MNPKMRPRRRHSVSDEFERETKLVVLNFMGLVPASCPATADVCESVRVDVSLDDDEDVAQGSHSALPGGNCDLQAHLGPLPELPGEETEETCTLPTGSIQSGTLNGEQSSELSDSNGAKGVDIVVNEDGSVDKAAISGTLQQDSHTSSADQQISQPYGNSTQNVQSGFLQTPPKATSSRTPSPCGAACHASLERQSSSRSTTSSRSRSSGTRNSCINVQQADLETLIKTNTLPPLVIPLRDGISHEMEVLGQENPESDADPTQVPTDSPETEVADMLRTVGDRVNEEFGEMLAEAVAAVLPPLAADQDIPYATLRSVAENLIGRMHPGWSQVAMVLLFSQSVAFSMLRQGHSRIGNLADSTTRFIEDHVADFIISNGGWQSILDMEVNDLFDGSNEVQSSADEQDDRGPPRTIIDSSHSQTLCQGLPATDTTKPAADSDCQLTADHSKVPSISDDVSSDSYQTDAESPPVAGDLDIFLYMALGAIIAVMASAFYTQVMKK